MVGYGGEGVEEPTSSAMCVQTNPQARLGPRAKHSAKLILFRANGSRCWGAGWKETLSVLFPFLKPHHSRSQQQRTVSHGPWCPWQGIGAPYILQAQASSLGLALPHTPCRRLATFWLWSVQWPPGGSAPPSHGND